MSATSNPPSGSLADPCADPQAEARGTAGEPERRRSGGRSRGRDRLLDRAVRPYARNESLDGVDDVENLMLFIDDDLRETALSIERIEAYLVRALDTLDDRALSSSEVMALARDPGIFATVDALGETLESLRRRLSKLAVRLR